jgi:hypothetical protein
MSSTGFNVDTRDLHFVLFEQLRIHETLADYDKFQDWDKEMYETLIEAARDLCVDVMAPANAEGDRVGCTLDPNGDVTIPACYEDGWNAMREGGWIGVSAPMEYGGVGLPLPIAAMANELMNGANPALLMYAGLTKGAAGLIAACGNDWAKDTCCEKLFTGQWAGTMCLTEAHAGTDVGSARTKATPNDDGTYNITGEKIFISCADQQFVDNVIHLVLARLPDAPPGSKGISIFIVPKFNFDDNSRNGAFIEGLEHKMGINGSATCSISFGARSECKGYIVGEPGEGLKIMFHMMNEARIGVGIQGVGAAAAALGNALSYAKEREQGGAGSKRVPIIKHPDVRRMLLSMKSKTEAMRSLTYTLSLHHDISELEENEFLAAKHQGYVELLTPICKSYCTDVGYDVTTTGVQVFGGFGYIKEYPMEQHVRDVKIASIYEGTNGVQALDLLGRKLTHKNGMFFMQWLDFTNQEFERAKTLGCFEAEVGAIEKTRGAVGACAMHLGQIAMTGNRKGAALHATPFLNMFGNVVLAVHSLTQATVAQEALNKGDCSESDKRFYAGKVANLKWYVYNELPQAIALSKSILSGDETALEPGLFGE